MFQFKLTQREICYKEAHSREWHTFCYQKFKNMETTRLPSNKLERNNQNHLKPPKPSTIEPNIKKKRKKVSVPFFVRKTKSSLISSFFFFTQKSWIEKREKRRDLLWLLRRWWLLGLRAWFRMEIFRPLFRGLTFSLKSSHSFPLSRFDIRNSVSGSILYLLLLLLLLDLPKKQNLVNQSMSVCVCSGFEMGRQEALRHFLLHVTVTSLY